MPELKGQKRLPGYLILFLQEQAKEFYSCTKPVTSGWIRSKLYAVQIICLTSIWFLCFGQWAWWKIRCQMDHHTLKKYTCCFSLWTSLFLSSTLLYRWLGSILFSQNDPCSFWRDIQTGSITVKRASGLSRLLLDFLTQRRSKDCSMAD